MAHDNRFVFAGGGTGGHLFPAMSVVQSLRRREPTCEVSFFCTQRAIDREILEPAGIEAVPQVVLPFPAKPWLWPAFLLRWRQSVGACLARFSQQRPTAVIGAGGYASGPPVRAAVKLGIPTFLLNPDAVPGRANQHMAAKGQIRGVFAQWEVTKKHFSPSVAVEVAGCPVRQGFRDAANLAPGPIRASFGLDPELPTLLVTGAASQGARTINEAMVELADTVAAAGWQVLHLSGPADAARIERAYATSGAGLRYKVLAFTDRMPEAMAASDLIISRAGASTLSEIQAVGKPSILLPYPYGDGHQRYNAQVLVEAEAAVMVDDEKEVCANAAHLGPILASLMGDAQFRNNMARAARNLDRPEAAECIAACLLNTNSTTTRDGGDTLENNACGMLSRHTA